MNDALLQMLESKMLPGPWRSWPGALMRFFLPPAVADAFAIPAHPLEERILQHAVDFRHELDSRASESEHRSWILRKFALSFIQGLVTAELGGKRTPFILSTNLHHEWAMAHRTSIWDQLRRS